MLKQALHRSEADVVLLEVKFSRTESICYTYKEPLGLCVAIYQA